MKGQVFEILCRACISGSAASLLSLAALLAHGERECRSAFAPVNAVSHWIWARRALHQQDGSLRYTLPGYGIHHGASVFWATLYEAGAQRFEPRGRAAHVGLGLAVAALACLVDLRLTPERLTPGFERRLGSRSLLTIYASFGLGLALPALLGNGRASSARTRNDSRRRPSNERR